MNNYQRELSKMIRAGRLRASVYDGVGKEFAGWTVLVFQVTPEGMASLRLFKIIEDQVVLSGLKPRMPPQTFPLAEQGVQEP
jgi:hypothetical protein